MKWLQGLVVAAAVVICGLALWFWYGENPHHNALLAREVATRGLAEHLAKTSGGGRVLVISNPFTQRKGVGRDILATEEAGLSGLRAGFRTNLILEAVVFPELKAGAEENPRSVFIDAETTTPLSYLVAEDAFDKLVSQHPACDLVVSLVGLPAELERVQCWQTNGPPRFALLLPDLRIVGDTAAVKAALKSGKLAAFVLAKPGTPDSQSVVGSNFGAEFEQRFVLVTPENVDQVTQTYTNLF